MSVDGKDKEGRAESVVCLSLKSNQSRESPLAFSKETKLPNAK